MFNFIVRRVTLGLVIVVMAVSSLYVLVQAAPGDPVAILLGPRGTEEMRAALYAKFGLDQPLPVQVVKFLGRVLQGDLGTDLITKEPVSKLVFAQLAHTMRLIAAALLIATLFGIPLGCLSAVYRGSWLDRVTGVLAVSVIAMPALIIAIYGMLLFAVKLSWVPAIGAGEPGDLVDQLHHLILPAIAVGIGWIGYLARLVRASLLEVLGEDYILNARAYGISERRIVFRYALRIAIAPALTVLGIGVGIMLGSAVFAEIIFARPGIGKLMSDAVSARNYPLTMGVVLIGTVFMIAAITISDILNALLDPRVREAQE